MPDSNLCINDQPHRFHRYREEVEVSCSGTTSCGQQDHEPHKFLRMEDLWCRGICACGDAMRGRHGPGEHK